MQLVRLERRGDVAVMTIANPPVNAISASVVAALAAAIESFELDRSYRALLVHCDGATFVAGGDISSFADPDFSAAPFNDTLARIEALDRPVVASLYGSVLGGGLELALACHWRVAQSSTKLGMPEVKLGLLPGSLGTQRLPRVAGIELALDMISTGRTIGAQDAKDAGIIDELRDGVPLETGLTFAQ